MAVLVNLIRAIPCCAQCVDGRRRYPVFDPERGANRRARLDAPRRSHSRRCDRGLYIHAEVDDIRDDLDQALPDSVASGRSERHIGLAVL